MQLGPTFIQLASQQLNPTLGLVLEIEMTGSFGAPAVKP